MDRTWLCEIERRIRLVTDHEIEAVKERLPEMNPPSDTDLGFSLDYYHQQMFVMAEHVGLQMAEAERKHNAAASSNRAELNNTRLRLQQEMHTIFNMFLMSVSHKYKIWAPNQMIQVRQGWRACLVKNMQIVRTPEPTHQPVQYYRH